MNQLSYDSRLPERTRRKLTAITKFGASVTVDAGDVTAMKWEAPTLTILLFETVLMDFKDSDAESVLSYLSELRIPIDRTLGVLPR